MRGLAYVAVGGRCALWRLGPQEGVGRLRGPGQPAGQAEVARGVSAQRPQLGRGEPVADAVPVHAHPVASLQAGDEPGGDRVRRGRAEAEHSPVPGERALEHYEGIDGDDLALADPAMVDDMQRRV